MDAQIDLHFADVFDALDQFVIILDGSGQVAHANQAAQTLTGQTQDRMLGLPLWEIAWPALSSANRRRLRLAVARAGSGEPVRSELAVRRGGDLKLDVDFALQPILDETGTVRYILVEGRDETIFKQTSEALYRSEARFRTIYEKAGVGIFIKSVEGWILTGNPAFQAMLGYSHEELVQMKYLDITHPEDRAASRRLFNELIAGKRATYSLKKRYLHKDGRIIWGNITTSVVRGPDPEVQYVIAIVDNITAQKQIESELVELQRRLMRGREMERVRISQDLHDGPLQEIIGISFQVQELKSTLSNETDRGQLLSIQDALQRVTRSVRAVCGELRPPTLVPFGLEKTIRAHAGEFQAAHPDMRMQLDLDEDGQELSELVRIVLFRIYQEAMNNIQRHSGASQVTVRFKLDKARARLEVADNGKGFSLPGRWVDLANQGHLGLVGAREHAQEVGGSLKVTSAKNHGTLVRAVLPLKEETTLAFTAGREVNP